MSQIKRELERKMSTEDIQFDTEVWKHLAKGLHQNPYHTPYPFLMHRNETHKTTMAFSTDPVRVDVFLVVNNVPALLGCVRPAVPFKFDEANPYQDPDTLSKVRNTVAESNQAILNFIKEQE